MRKLITSHQAQHELKNIRSYTLKKWGRQQSIKYIKKLYHTALLLSKNPQLGTHRPDLKKRSL